VSITNLFYWFEISRKNTNIVPNIIKHAKVILSFFLKAAVIYFWNVPLYAYSIWLGKYLIKSKENIFFYIYRKSTYMYVYIFLKIHFFLMYNYIFLKSIRLNHLNYYPNQFFFFYPFSYFLLKLCQIKTNSFYFILVFLFFRLSFFNISTCILLTILKPDLIGWSIIKIIQGLDQVEFQQK